MYSVRTRILDFLGKSNIDSWTKFVMKSQDWSQDQIRQYQEEQFHRLVDHVFSNSPFYMKYFAERGIERSDLKSLDDIGKFPVMRREDVAENLDDLLATNMAHFAPMKRSTGGTTGTPLVYYSDKEAWSLGWALKLRDWSYGNYSLGQKMGVFAGGSLIPNSGFNLKREIWNKITGIHPFPMAHYNDAAFAKAQKEVVSGKFQFLRGYPTSLLSFAEYLKRKGEVLPMKAIFSTAEVLQPAHREIIEEVFQTKVFDQYGCADSGGHASQRDASAGFQISFEPSFSEFINPEKNYDGEEIVELIFTNWYNYSMPVLRYAPGDLATIDNASTSQDGQTPNLKRIIGRTTERIKFANGNILAGPAFTLFFRLFELKSYQLIQTGPLSIAVNLIPKEGFSPADKQKIAENLAHHAGPEVEVDIRIVSEIKPAASGKHRFIIALKEDQ